MNSELTRAGLRIGFLLVIPSTVLLLVLDRRSAEFSITVVTLVMGVVFLLGVLLFERYRRR